MNNYIEPRVPQFLLLVTIASKINITPIGVYLPVSKLHSILAVANLISHICLSSQISLQITAVNCSSSDKLTPLRATFILVVLAG